MLFALPTITSRTFFWARLPHLQVVRIGRDVAIAARRRLTPIAPELEARIRQALATPGRPGVRKIAERFGVNPGTVQRITRPFEVSAVSA